MSAITDHAGVTVDSDKSESKEKSDIVDLVKTD